MTSKLIVNELASDTGISTITVGDNMSGVTFKTGTSNLHSTGYECTNINATGIITATTFSGTLSGGLPITNGVNNRIITAVSASAIQGEANLTYDGVTLQQKQTGDTGQELIFDSNRSDTDNMLGGIAGYWDTDRVADISFRAAADTSNKDDGYITFRTSLSQGGITERVRITSAGLVGIGATTPEVYSNLAYNLVLRTTGNTGMTIRSGSSSKGSILFAVADNNTSNEGIFQYDHNNKAFEFNNYGGGAEKFIYKIQGNQKIIIDNNGNMGLGDAAPTNFTNYTNLSIHGPSGGAITFGDDGTDEWEIYGGDGAFRIYDRASTTERLRIDDSGKIGVGVAPNAWQSSTTSKVIQIGNSSVWDYDLQQFDLGQNFWYDGTDYHYIANGYATKFSQLKSDGSFIFYQAASGTGGNNVTWLEKLKLNNGYAGTVDVKGIPAHLRLYSQRDTSDWDNNDEIGKIEFHVGDDASNNLPYTTNFIKSVNTADNKNEPDGAIVFGSCRHNQSGGAVETMRLTHSEHYDNVANLRTQGVGAIRDVYNMMNIGPDGSFDRITNNSDGGNTYWEIQNGTTIRLHSTSGGHGGEWGRGIALRQAGFYYWRMCVRVTTTCTYIHSSTATNKYRYPIAFRFNLHASGDGNSSNISLWNEFATAGTCNGSQSGTGTLAHGTMITKTSHPVYLPQSTYQPIYHTNGYQGVRELNIYSLELVQCGATTSGAEHNGTW